MSDTPRTDRQPVFVSNGNRYVAEKFAENIEREHAGVQKAHDLLKGVFDQTVSENEELKSDLAEAREKLEDTAETAVALAVLANQQDGAIKRMFEIIKRIAGQKLTSEMDAEELENADFEGGYDYIIEDCRRAKKELENIKKAQL